MTEYRLYFLNSVGSIARGGMELEFETDADAIEHASQFVDGLALELWAGTRMVSRIEPAKHLDTRSR